MTARIVSTRATLQRGARYILGTVLLTLLGLIVLATVSTTARADTWLTFGFLSLHDAPGYNGANYGLGIEHEIGERAALVAGAYENSHHERSRYVGANIVAAKVRGVRLGATVGAVDGYRHRWSRPVTCNPYTNNICGHEIVAGEQKVAPLLTATAAINGKRWGVNVALVPPGGSKEPTAIAIQLKRRIGRLP
jgi:hypothetical protein